MADTRRKNVDWRLPETINWDHVQVALLMDIRGELRSIHSLLACHRVPRALDALIEVGADIRRKKRAASSKRRKAKAGA